MKNIKQILAILLTLICVFNFKPCIAYADDDGYYIKITLNKDNSFKLTKIKDLDDKHKSYEKSIFREIFKFGKNNTVTYTQLKDAEIKSILDAKEDIKSYFNNEKSLKDKSSYKKARLMGLLPVISTPLVSVPHMYFFRTFLFF